MFCISRVHLVLEILNLQYEADCPIINVLNYTKSWMVVGWKLTIVLSLIYFTLSYHMRF